MSERYALSNPLSGGELVLVGITGLIGYGLADFVGRYLETTPVATGTSSTATPTGATVPNNVATAGWPTWQTAAAQFGIAAVPMIASEFVDSPWGRAALQGVGLGAGFALFGGLFKSTVAYLFGTTALGQQLYSDEYNAQQLQAQAAGTNTTTLGAGGSSLTLPGANTVGTSGLPRGLGKPRALTGNRLRPPVDVGPKARGVGAPATMVPVAVAPPATVSTQTPAPVPLPSPPPTNVTQPNCAPCSITHGGLANTYPAAVNEAQQMGFGAVPVFPE
jgi:hypothetical protein